MHLAQDVVQLSVRMPSKWIEITAKSTGKDRRIYQPHIRTNQSASRLPTYERSTYPAAQV